MEAQPFALVILNYRFPEITKKCLESLSKCDRKLFKIFLVNNYPQDGSTADLHAFLSEKSLNATCFDSAINLGFAGGANAGMRLALEEGFNRIALLNNDTEVLPDFADRVQQACRELSGGIIAGLVLEADSGKPTYNVARISNLDLTLTFDFSDRTPRRVDFVSGGFLVTHRDTLMQCGFLEDRYFMYCEDYELCLRWKQAGVPIHFRPEIKVYHAVSSTTDRLRTPKEYYRIRNQTHAILRHGTGLQKVFYGLHLMALMAYKIRHPKIWAEFYRGIRDALLNRLGPRLAP